MHVCAINIYESQVFLTLGGCLSVVCLSIIFYLFYFANIPNLRRHPTTLIIRRCWLEVIFVSQYLWFAFAPYDFFWDSYSYDDDSPNCTTNPQIWPLSWLTQFSLLGAELWFLVLSIDIHVSLTNPFSSHIINDKYYFWIANSFSAFMATLLVAYRPIQFGVSSDPMIWVKDSSKGTTLFKVVMFYAFAIVIFLYCGTIMLWARWQIHRGLEENLKMRKYSVSKQTRYVIGYFFYYSFLYSFQFALYINEYFAGSKLNGDVNIGVRTWCAFLYASRGVWALGIFIISNWVELQIHYKRLLKSRQQQQQQQAAIMRAISHGTNDSAPTTPTLEAPETPGEEEELVQLNIALQKEIVRFISSGIQRAVREMDTLGANEKHRHNSVRSSKISGTLTGWFSTAVI